MNKVPISNHHLGGRPHRAAPYGEILRPPSTNSEFLVSNHHLGKPPPYAIISAATCANFTAKICSCRSISDKAFSSAKSDTARTAQNGILLT